MHNDPTCAELSRDILHDEITKLVMEAIAGITQHQIEEHGCDKERAISIAYCAVTAAVQRVFVSAVVSSHLYTNMSSRLKAQLMLLATETPKQIEQHLKDK